MTTTMPRNIRTELEAIMPTVEKPSRYLGTELNSTHKNPADVDLRVALVFPDLYDLGLGNLGILILYAILNDLPWCWCERAYTPAPDMETKLRENDLPLFVNESKDSLDEMDLIGFTLQSELTYTNILNAIDLAGLPLRTADRGDDHPLIMAGGPSVFNPEPLAPFIDFFIIGEGEDAIVELAEVMRAHLGATRSEKLEALAKLEGVYIPELYPFETLPDGRILPKEDAAPIVKRTVQDLDGARFPTNYIVPFTQQVHDRIGLEVLRGCTQGCRFCQAGMVTRPVRERSLDKVDELLERTLENTGYEEVSLVSLSTCDFSRPRTLVERAAQAGVENRVSVSLPSLRLDSFSVELADMVAGVRRSGLTFAPEAATPRLRAVINKWIPDEELLQMSAEAYKRGWKHIKTYFMIGLPTERDEDVEAIVDLCARTLAQGKTIRPSAKINTGVSTFVPKPFTPFQWAAQISLDEAKRRQGILEAGFKKLPGIKFGRHEARLTFIEGLLTRSDRRAGDLLEAAWRNGARLESWDEHLNWNAWTKAIEETGFDADDALRERALDERLPWDHIDVLIPKSWFQEDWARALELKHAQDCRAGKCHLCGVIYRERDLCKHMLKRQKAGRAEEADWTPTPRPAYEEPLAVQRLRLRIGRSGEARFLSHLELVNVWIRALRRAKAPLSYSQGFHAHPRINFSSAPPVGEESRGDLMDIVLKSRIDAEAFLARLIERLPTGIHAFTIEEVPLNAPALMASLSGHRYRLEANESLETIECRVAELLDSDEINVERRQKKKAKGGRYEKRRPAMKLVNVRPMIAELRAEPSAQGCSIHLETRVVEKRGVRIREILAMLQLDSATTRIVKEESMLAESVTASA